MADQAKKSPEKKAAKASSPAAPAKKKNAGAAAKVLAAKAMAKKKGPKRSLKSGQVRFRKPKKEKKALFVEKPVGGEKNGGTRLVRTKRRPSGYSLTDRPPKRRTGLPFRMHKRYIRKTLTPGTICILVAGPHKGKRVVLLKQLASGLLLVTGPYKLNGCPLRRVNQIYAIATSTKLDLKGVKLPVHLNDKYFRRKKQKRAKKEEGDIFASKSEAYQPSDKRKKDQTTVDKKVMEAIAKTSEKGLVKKYLSSLFYLRTRQFPHKMKF